MTLGNFVIENAWWLISLAFGVLILVLVFQFHAEQKRLLGELARLNRSQAYTHAVQVWGTNPAGWPSEVRDVLDVIV